MHKVVLIDGLHGYANPRMPQITVAAVKRIIDMGHNILGFGTFIAAIVVSSYLLKTKLPGIEAKLSNPQCLQVGCLGVIGVLLVLTIPGILGMYKPIFDIQAAVPVFIGGTGWLFFGNLLMRAILRILGRDGKK